MKMSSLVFMSVVVMSQYSFAGTTYELKPACAQRIKKVVELISDSYLSSLSAQDKKNIQIIVDVDTNAVLEGSGDGEFAATKVKAKIKMKDLTTGVISEPVPAVAKVLDASLDCIILSVAAQPF